MIYADQTLQASHIAAEAAAIPAAATTEEHEPPCKRQKRSAQEGKNGDDVSIIATASHSAAFVVVTEDKSLTVLSLAQNATIHEHSRRTVPKRPSAVQIIQETNTILCADKFGDVYALPLYTDQPWPYTEARSEPTKAGSEEPLFKPSATKFTVHSKQNRKALESQQRQKSFTPRKEPLAFEHKLILGHVSMLTDMIYVAASEDGRRTAAIITADRDEHIRISRSLPQAHIIKGYCLGHQEFVSKLCHLDGTTLLVSGGGDDWLGLWDYTTFQLKQKIDMRQALVDGGIALNTQDNLALTILREVRISAPETSVLFAVCERIAAVLTIVIDHARDTAPLVHATRTEDNPIAIETFADQRVIVSFDARNADRARLQSYQLLMDDGPARLELEQDGPSVLRHLNALNTDSRDSNSFDSSLYNIASMRKRRGWADLEEEPD